MTNRILVLKTFDGQEHYFRSIKNLIEENPQINQKTLSKHLKEKGLYWKEGIRIERRTLK